MRKLVVAMLMTLSMSACTPQAHVLVKNDCQGAYLRIARLEGAGDQDVVAEELMPGQRVNVSLTGAGGYSNKFIIVADGFRISDNRPLGSAEMTLWVSSSNGPTATQNNYTWSVNWLNPGGCPGN